MTSKAELRLEVNELWDEVERLRDDVAALRFEKPVVLETSPFPFPPFGGRDVDETWVDEVEEDEGDCDCGAFDCDCDDEPLVINVVLDDDEEDEDEDEGTVEVSEMDISELAEEEADTLLYMAERLRQYVPQCRERDLALTKIDEARLWLKELI